jgi:hypothetical protein
VLGHKAHGDEKGQEPDQRPRFARSPTRAGDFAPNASDHESNDQTDSESSDGSNQNTPTEHKPDPLSTWVKDVIRIETSKESGTMVEEFFTSSNPEYKRCQHFFQRLNQHIRGANEKHHVNDIDIGTIPETGYNGIRQTWQQAGEKAIANHSQSEFWTAFNNTRDLLKHFNKRHYLPKSWNINQACAEEWVGTPNPRMEEETNSTSKSDNGQTEPIPQLSASEESSAESGDEPTGLDALEARTIKQQRQLNSAKVLYWWPKGTGSQIFVRYGSRSTPIYRIRAGSHESYNPSRVERVLTTKSRGTAKVIGTRNGLPEELWKYKRKDVEDFIGIGWKVDEDDEQGLEPLNLLLPAQGISYPQTRILVKWKDGIFTVEGRSFIRRVTSGSALDGDRVIYQKAEELEYSYRRSHGLEDVEDDDIYTESDGSNQPRWTSRRRHFREPAFVSNSRSKKTKTGYRSEPVRHSDPLVQKARTYLEISTDEESNVSAQSRQIRNRRYRSEPVHQSHPRRKHTKTHHSEANSDEESDDIRSRVYHGSSSTEGSGKVKRRPRYRRDRGRTA